MVMVTSMIRSFCFLRLLPVCQSIISALEVHPFYFDDFESRECESSFQVAKDGIPILENVLGIPACFVFLARNSLQWTVED